MRKRKQKLKLACEKAVGYSADSRLLGADSGPAKTATNGPRVLPVLEVATDGLTRTRTQNLIEGCDRFGAWTIRKGC